MSESDFKSIKLHPNLYQLVDISFIKKEYYKEDGILYGAKIFAILFKIIEAKNFAKSTDPDINLRYFNITQSQWNLLYGFLTIVATNLLPSCHNIWIH